MSRRRREHRDPLGDKVCDEARRDVVISALRRIVVWADTEDHREFSAMLLDTFTKGTGGMDPHPLLVLLEQGVFEEANSRVTDITQWVTSMMRSHWAGKELLPWLHGDTPAGHRCAMCAVRLPDTTGRRGRPRKYCSEPCKRQAMEYARNSNVGEGPR